LPGLNVGFSWMSGSGQSDRRGEATDLRVAQARLSDRNEAGNVTAHSLDDLIRKMNMFIRRVSGRNAGSSKASIRAPRITRPEKAK